MSLIYLGKKDKVNIMIKQYEIQLTGKMPREINYWEISDRIKVIQLNKHDGVLKIQCTHDNLLLLLNSLNHL